MAARRGRRCDGEAALAEPEQSTFEQEALGLLDAVYKFARWLTRGEADARDLVQETYLLALQARHRFQPGTNLRAWLFRIARNRFLDGYQRRQREPLWDDELLGVRAAPGVTESLLGDRDLGRLQGLVRGDIARALDSLPEVYRSAIVLADVEGMTWEETAEVLGVPVGTIQSRVFRGRRALRLLLKDYAPPRAGGTRGPS